MFSHVNFKRSHAYGLTTLELRGPTADLELRLLSQMGKRERRALVRSFLAQIRPWIEHFTQAAIDHSNDGTIRNRRARNRGIKNVQANSVSSLPGLVGMEIRMKRLELGLNQTQLAQSLGIQRSHLSDIERGLYLPNGRTRLEIERVLQIRIG